MEGGEHWHGPQDLSGILLVGTSGNTISLAATVLDDHLEAGGGADAACVEFFLDRRSEILRMRDDEFSPDGKGLLRIRVWPDGRSEFVGIARDFPGVGVAVHSHGDGFGVEVALPTLLFPDFVSTGRLYLDLALTDKDLGDKGMKTLCFSGNVENHKSSMYYATFSRRKGRDLRPTQP